MRILFSFVFFILLTNCFAITQNIIPPVIVIPNHNLTKASITVITHEDIAAAGATSLSQVLQSLGGVQLQDITGNGSQVMLSLRGFGANASSNSLLLINGIPITNPDLAPPNLNIIPLNEIKSVEIISGSESVLYGDQAVGGIINIITTDNLPKKLSISGEIGSFNQKNLYATVQNHFHTLSYGLNIFAKRTDNYRDHNDYTQNLLSGKINYDYATGQIALIYQIGNEHMLYPGALTAAEVRQNRRQANNDTNFFRNWNGSFHLQNQQQLCANWKLITDLTRREMHGDGVLTSPFNQSRIIHFIRPQLKGFIGNNLLLTGLDAEEDNYRLQSLFGTTQDKEEKLGIFGLINHPLTSQLDLAIGARGAQQNSQLTSFSKFNNINRAFASTVGLTFKLNPWVNIYLRRAENFRFPKADENASVASGVNGLKTQRGVSNETGIEWIYLRSLSKLNIYQLNLRDEIMFDPLQTPQNPFGVNTNLPPTQRQGFSFSEKISPCDRIAVDGQYNFVNARFRKGQYAGNRIPLVSENILRAGVDYKISPNWNIYSEAIYTGNQYSDNDNANIAGKMGGYTLYNINVRYFFRNFSAILRLNNIFNKYYYFYTVYQPSLNEQFFYPAPGRSFLLTLKYDCL